MGSEKSVATDKKNARARAKRHRDIVQREYIAGTGIDFETAIAFLEKFGNGPPGPVAGYWPIGSEFDIRDLLERLCARGYSCCLPVVIGADRPLIFRKWSPAVSLLKGSFDVHVPPVDADIIIPRIVLTPLLTFDDRGYRLGYGGGFYDRTLCELRRVGNVFAVGMAYSGQHTDKVPADRYDQPLDAVITESYSRVFE